MNYDDFVVVRSDRGDGGWSIHPPGTTDKQIAEGLAPVLLSGTARWLGKSWSRPKGADFRAAHARMVIAKSGGSHAS